MIQLEKPASWHEERLKGIGASDAPIVMGVGKRSRLRLWQEKRGEITPPDVTNRMLAGILFEDVVASMFARQHPHVTIRRKTRAVWDKRGLPMFAHLDRDGRDATNKHFLLECKTAGYAQHWGESGTSEIPYYYEPQIQHALYCTGYDYAWVAVFIFETCEFRYYIVPRDDEYIERLTGEIAAFWRLVQTGTQPAPLTIDETIECYPDPSGAIQATPEIVEAVKKLRDARAAIKQGKADEEAAKNIIAPFMGNADLLKSGNDVIATFKRRSNGKRFQQEPFQVAHPALFEEFTLETFTRAMLVAKGLD